MKSSTPFWMMSALVFLLVGGPESQSASAAPMAAGACGLFTNTHSVIEPPSVDMWSAPVNTSGEHELILAVHRDGDRFCYRYSWNGVVQTVAPTIHVRHDEHFAIRIVNDIPSRSPGEKVPSNAIPPCKPMYMPAVPPLHWVGYLNHVIDDRFFHVPVVDTNLHLHGFEGPASEENVFLSTLSTSMHACEYRVTIPSKQPPGTYLYHPHSHGTSDDELAGGLVGTWVVEPDSPQIPRADEHMLLLRYRLPFVTDKPQPDMAHYLAQAAAHEAALKPGTPVRYDPFDPPAWPATHPMRAGGITFDPTGCNGVNADAVVSVNDAVTPSSLSIPADRTQLLRIVNATSDSPKLVRIRDARGHVLPFRVVELDGVPISGDMEHPLARYVPMKELMLSPMSRAGVLLNAAPGATFVLSSEPFCDGKDGSFQMHHDLLRIHAVNDAGGQAYSVHSRPVAIADTPAARIIAFTRAHPSRVRRRAITFTQYIFPKHGKVPMHAGFYITDTTDPNFHEHPFWPDYRPGATVPSNPEIVIMQGTIEEWYLINATMEAHAFHIHQMAFVQENNFIGLPVTVDTVFVPAGTLRPNPRDPDYPLIQPSITKVILDFRHVPRGTFVFHCHMLYHEDRGMMGVIQVE